MVKKFVQSAADQGKTAAMLEKIQTLRKSFTKGKAAGKINTTLAGYVAGTMQKKLLEPPLPGMGKPPADFYDRPLDELRTIACSDIHEYRKHAQTYLLSLSKKKSDE